MRQGHRPLSPSSALDARSVVLPGVPWAATRAASRPGSRVWPGLSQGQHGVVLASAACCRDRPALGSSLRTSKLSCLKRKCGLEIVLHKREEGELLLSERIPSSPTHLKPGIGHLFHMVVLAGPRSAQLQNMTPPSRQQGGVGPVPGLRPRAEWSVSPGMKPGRG